MYTAGKDWCVSCGSLRELTSSYTTYVNGDGSNYRDAYYEINYVNIYNAAKSTVPGVEGGLPADGPVAGNNNLGRQVTTIASSSVSTQANGATSVVEVTVTQAIPDTSVAPTASSAAGNTQKGAASRAGPAFALAALAVAAAALF